MIMKKSVVVSRAELLALVCMRLRDEAPDLKESTLRVSVSDGESTIEIKDEQHYADGVTVEWEEEI